MHKPKNAREKHLFLKTQKFYMQTTKPTHKHRNTFHDVVSVASLGAT